MTVDYTKLILYSPANAFKNVNKYTGSLSFPTSLTSGQVATVTSTIQLTDNPVYTQFFANFLEVNEAISLYVSAAGTTPKRWYMGSVPGNFGVGIHINAPLAHVGWISCGIYPVVVGNTVVITGTVINPFAVTITLDALTVAWSLVEFTLAG